MGLMSLPGHLSRSMRYHCHRQSSYLSTETASSVPIFLRTTGVAGAGEELLTGEQSRLVYAQRAAERIAEVRARRISTNGIRRRFIRKPHRPSSTSAANGMSQTIRA